MQRNKTDPWFTLGGPWTPSGLFHVASDAGVGKLFDWQATIESNMRESDWSSSRWMEGFSEPPNRRKTYVMGFEKKKKSNII